jgi:hypothetical protein
MSECVWAPFGHVAAAGYLVTLARPCGHNPYTAPSCVEHAARLRAEPVARQATACTACGEVNSITVIEVRTFGAAR